ncbi:MAG: bacteriocin-protection protein [Flavobacterium sp. BFFFF1]|uniref:YdeI/OmpD-associated family protein n=1 Tax=Flavobacterium sp. BFFFF1 TaxID=2015557 RepID=UPI000BDB11D5|nr:YdeI/OmpD-associated family protein [Flavobacterium sp. BFFFF1]OYU81238.1 MAG: bacteriocin-protection protein [Flavobacterium sp. BFFFF1]
MKPKFFKTAADFRKWLEENHDKYSELIVGYYKTGSGKPSMNWPDSVDQALSFGWIDGHLKPIDAISYTRRFTPRKPNSIWSNVNIKKAEKLIQGGLMHESGMEVYRLRKEDKSGIYAFEKPLEVLDKEIEKQFKVHKKAWDFFEKQAPSYKKVIIHWLMHAKQEKTQHTRLEKLILACEEGKRIR